MVVSFYVIMICVNFTALLTSAQESHRSSTSGHKRDAVLISGFVSCRVSCTSGIYSRGKEKKFFLHQTLFGEF